MAPKGLQYLEAKEEEPSLQDKLESITEECNFLTSDLKEAKVAVKYYSKYVMGKHTMMIKYEMCPPWYD